MKRFYKQAGYRATAAGFELTLDNRGVKTPAKRALAVPTEALAQALADEWQAQGDEVKPQSMPLTKIANAMIDGVVLQPEETRASILEYRETDMVCYWADYPEDLVVRQAKAWQPLLQWLADHHGVRLETTAGVLYKPQAAEALDRLAAIVAGVEPWRLGALHMLTTGTGSLVIALAVLGGRLNAAEACAASEVDSTYQTEQWGEDAEAEGRRRAVAADITNAVRFLDLLSVG